MSGGAFCGLTGRAAADAERRESKGGTTYATCRLAVDIDRQREGDPDPQPWWITAMAFGRSADALAAVRKGEALHVAGRLERARFTGRDRAEREAWNLIADSVITARPASGRGKRRAAQPAGPAEPEPADEWTPSEGDIPF